MEASIAGMLLAGVIVSAIVVVLGGILYVHQSAKTIPNYSRFVASHESLWSIAPLLHGVILGVPRSVIQLGVLMLIATPVVRVLFCIVGFARQRDRIYIIISSSVFLILIYSLFQRSR